MKGHMASVLCFVCSVLVCHVVSVIIRCAPIDVSLTCSVIINQFSTLLEHKDCTSQLSPLSIQCSVFK
jgi:hypothetical protein